jgi:hypothetical protein
MGLRFGFNMASWIAGVIDEQPQIRNDLRDTRGRLMSS